MFSRKPQGLRYKLHNKGFAVTLEQLTFTLFFKKEREYKLNNLLGLLLFICLFITCVRELEQSDLTIRRTYLTLSIQHLRLLM